MFTDVSDFLGFPDGLEWLTAVLTGVFVIYVFGNLLRIVAYVLGGRNG